MKAGGAAFLLRFDVVNSGGLLRRGRGTVV
jgi:hypothetical protein